MAEGNGEGIFYHIDQPLEHFFLICQGIAQVDLFVDGRPWKMQHLVPIIQPGFQVLDGLIMMPICWGFPIVFNPPCPASVVKMIVLLLGRGTTAIDDFYVPCVRLLHRNIIYCSLLNLRINGLESPHWWSVHHPEKVFIFWWLIVVPERLTTCISW